MVFELQGMELLIDEHKLQIDEKNKLKNIKKVSETEQYHKFNNFCYNFLL